MQTHFRFPGDAGSFAAASERCFGVGACRDQEGTMCPSYQATMEEQHSTRGRARLLNEMMRTDSIEGGWRNESVKEALDLCLACKGCKHECPVRVDMATYKAEFLSHYWKGRLRPRQAYALGLIAWERAARAPGCRGWPTCCCTREPFATLGKALAGVARERTPPPFAAAHVHGWFAARQAPARRAGAGGCCCGPTRSTTTSIPRWRSRPPRSSRRPAVEVVVPERSLCCGRPLYDYGMLTLAKRQLRQILDTLRDEIQAGTPVIALEPSCGAVFRDELPNLFPDDEDAKRLTPPDLILGGVPRRSGR